MQEVHCIDQRRLIFKIGDFCHFKRGYLLGYTVKDASLGNNLRPGGMGGIEDGVCAVQHIAGLAANRDCAGCVVDLLLVAIETARAGIHRIGHIFHL